MATTMNIGKRETVVEAVAQALIRYIAANGLKGGDRLPSERELVQMVGVSRLPLREALCILKGLGIVEAQHGKGVFVRQLDVSTVFGMLSPLLKTQGHVKRSDILEVRLHLEPVLAGLAAEHRTEEDLRALKDDLRGMREEALDRRAFVGHDMAFHQALARATGNPVFHVFVASITDLLCEFQLKFPDKMEYREESIRFHESILEAVEGRDAERARSVMLEHIRVAGTRVQETPGAA